MFFLDKLECSYCQREYDPDQQHHLCLNCGKPLLARYDLKRLSRCLSRNDLSGRYPNLWRYRELLPVREDSNIITLGEGFTPLLKATRLGRVCGCPNLYIKDESLNPTCSFKSRGMSVAVSRAVELGVESISLPSAGNAAGALSAYAAAAGISAYVFMPKDVPNVFISECAAMGADVTLVDGLITDAGLLAARTLKEHGRYDMSTLKEPYRLEGKKTMGFELAEQSGWSLPDVIIYPTGGGTGLIGMWKSFQEMEELGWIDGKKPRMISVQSSGCAPIVRAFREGKEFAAKWQGARTIADGLRVPSAVGDFLILSAVKESGGTAVEVDDSGLIETAELIGKTCGLFVSPESAATLAALQKLIEEKFIREDESVILFNTGGGIKYSHLWSRKG